MTAHVNDGRKFLEGILEEMPDDEIAERTVIIRTKQGPRTFSYIGPRLTEELGKAVELVDVGSPRDRETFLVNKETGVDYKLESFTTLSLPPGYFVSSSVQPF